jgi:hypothetical protein
MTTILADRILLDLIERLENTRRWLEIQATGDADPTHLPMLTDNALRAAIDYLVALREARHADAQR